MVHLYEELGEESRRQILAELRTGPKNVTNLVEATLLKQPNVSNHLARLRSKGIVTATRSGREIIYSLSSDEILNAVKALFKGTQDRATQLDLHALARSFATAAVEGDEAVCSEILAFATRSRVGILEIFTLILQPAMACVGEWYFAGKIDVAQEHMASEITLQILSQAVQSFPAKKKRTEIAICGCGPNSYHIIGLRMFNDFLKLNGWKSIFLGANVPVDSFVAAVKKHRPNLVLINCSADVSVGSTLELIAALKAIRKPKRKLIIGVGGSQASLFPKVFETAGADFAAHDLRSFASELYPEIINEGRVPAALAGF